MRLSQYFNVKSKNKRENIHKNKRENNHKERYNLREVLQIDSNIKRNVSSIARVTSCYRFELHS